ncbi:MAG: glycosyltransferase [Haliscomenobacter sp.]|nr:glycosyltransferase [Haliscomenobacter sp.]
MSAIGFLSLGIYLISLTYVTVFGLAQFGVLYNYLRHSKRKKLLSHPSGAKAAQKVAVAALVGAEGGISSQQRSASGFSFQEEGDDDSQEFPFVTVQLPLYNEQYVVERLIDNIAQFDYPKDRFEIHVLDDSTDETQELVRNKVNYYKALGFNIEQIRRKVRKGYKAGALKDGMEFAKGEFMAIFDADFLPRPDFLRRTVPHFQDERVGVVQTRWEHINEDYSLLTRLQAFQLNVHFTVEQVGRMEGNNFLQFNGTAGLWRRQAIEDAGGWEADTLTEDLDLSIRAQLKGYKIKFLEDIGAPAELPAEMNSYRSQQFRWMKGGAETAKKMLPTIWNSDLSFGKKLHASMHLMASSIFVIVFILGVSSVPLVYTINHLALNYGFDKDSFTGFLVGLLVVAAVFYVANIQSPVRKESLPKAIFKYITLFPTFLALSMGLSLHNMIAVIEGWRGKKSPFVRTPKFNIQASKDPSLKANKYVMQELSWTTIMEGFLTMYFGIAAIWGAYWGETTFLVYHGMLTFGYGMVFLQTWKDAKRTATA